MSWNVQPKSVVRVSSETERKRQPKAPDEVSQTSDSPSKEISRVEKERRNERDPRIERELRLEKESSTAEDDEI